MDTAQEQTDPMKNGTQLQSYTSVFKACQLEGKKKKKTILAGLSCTEQWDILQLEAVLKQAGAPPRKSQSNIFSHMDGGMHSALDGMGSLTIFNIV